MRMPKGWTFIGTNSPDFHTKESREATLKREHNFKKAIHNLQTLTYEQLEKEGLDAYEKQIAYTQQLRDAKQKGILKSKRLLALDF